MIKTDMTGNGLIIQNNFNPSIVGCPDLNQFFSGMISSFFCDLLPCFPYFPISGSRETLSLSQVKGTFNPKVNTRVPINKDKASHNK